MKRSLTLLLAASLLVTACGTAERFASSERFSDGIYYRAPRPVAVAPARAPLSEEDFKLLGAAYLDSLKRDTSKVQVIVLDFSKCKDSYFWHTPYGFTWSRTPYPYFDYGPWNYWGPMGPWDPWYYDWRYSYGPYWASYYDPFWRWNHWGYYPGYFPGYYPYRPYDPWGPWGPYRPVIYERDIHRVDRGPAPNTSGRSYIAGSGASQYRNVRPVPGGGSVSGGYVSRGGTPVSTSAASERLPVSASVRSSGQVRTSGSTYGTGSGYVRSTARSAGQTPQRVEPGTYKSTHYRTSSMNSSYGTPTRSSYDRSSSSYDRSSYERSGSSSRDSYSRSGSSSSFGGSSYGGSSSGASMGGGSHSSGGASRGGSR